MHNDPSIIFLFAMLCIGCNAETGTPYPIEAIYGGPPPKLQKRTPAGDFAEVYIATHAEIKKAVKEQDWAWHDSKNNAFVFLRRGGEMQNRRSVCDLRRSKSSESHPLQITAHDGKDDEYLVAEVDSLDAAIFVLTWFLDEDPQWKEALEWKPVPKEDVPWASRGNY
jgi:hypothetical protein